MTMQSSNLLPALRELPGGDEAGQGRSFRDNMTGIVNMDRAMHGAEFAAAVSGGMWAIFDSLNVDDRLLQAYETRWPNMSEENSLYDKFREMTESGELSEHNNWLYSGLKGKLAEFEAEDLLESRGFTDVEFPDTEVNPGWDIKAIDPEGQEVLISVKTGVSDSQYEKVVDALQETDYFFAVGTELHERISESAPELVERLIDIGSDYELVEGITEGLDTLSSNLGIDVPDGVGDIIPYAGAIIAGARLVHSVLKTEKEFKAADRTTRNKIQVVQSLTLMSRIGITTTLATAGGMGGGALGSAVPGAGNLVGGIGGSLLGAGVGMYLNRHLQPHMLNLALDITGLTSDDLFYYKNKPRIDDVALNISQQARALAAPA